jgi:hypothetical protein
MQTRAANTKARFELATESGAGTKITVTAPLPLGHGLLYRLRAMLTALLRVQLQDDPYVTVP